MSSRLNRTVNTEREPARPRRAAPRYFCRVSPKDRLRPMVFLGNMLIHAAPPPSRCIIPRKPLPSADGRKPAPPPRSTRRFPNFSFPRIAAIATGTKRSRADYHFRSLRKLHPRRRAGEKGTSRAVFPLSLHASSRRRAEAGPGNYTLRDRRSTAEEISPGTTRDDPDFP